MEQPKGMWLHPPGERGAHGSAPVPTHQGLSTVLQLGAGPVLTTPIAEPLRSSPAQVTPSLFQGFIFPSPAFPGTLCTGGLKIQQVGLREMLSTHPAESSSRSAPLPASPLGLTLLGLPKPARRGRRGSSPAWGC